MTQQFHTCVYSQKKKNKKQMKTLIRKDTCTEMFTAELFTIVKIRK